MKRVCINRVHSVFRDSVARAILCDSAFGVLSLLCMLCFSCRDAGTLMTRSSGHPYEVVIVADDTASINLVRACLETPVEGLPQEEPAFDVIVERGASSNERARERESVREYQDARAVVKVLLTPPRQTGAVAPVSISYERNVEAQPQIIVTLKAASVEQLRRERQRWEASLRQLLTSFEQRATVALLRQHYNKQASDTLQQLFGVKLLVPPDMLSAHYEKDFVWLSNNATTGMQNICIFKGSDIDSVVGRYIRGETDEMHMCIVEQGAPKGMCLAVPPRESEVLCGLWEMEGDAMGGPFVARFITDSLSRQTTTVMAFVYAPETKKRNMVRKLEAVIFDASK